MAIVVIHSYHIKYTHSYFALGLVPFCAASSKFRQSDNCIETRNYQVRDTAVAGSWQELLPEYTDWLVFVKTVIISFASLSADQVHCGKKSEPTMKSKVNTTLSFEYGRGLEHILVVKGR